MQFSIISSLALAFISTSGALANCGETVKLYIDSEQPELYSKGVYAKHAGAGIDYFYLGSGATELTFENGQLYVEQSGYKQFFSVDSQFVQLTVSSTSASNVFSFVDYRGKQVLAVNGIRDDFYACKNTGDPYNYSANEYELMYYPNGNVPSDCSRVKLSRE